MTTVLQLNTSLFGAEAQSSRLAERFVADYRAALPDARVVVRDLAKDPVPHLTAARFQAFITKPEERTPEQQREAGVSDALVDEIKAADVIVIGLPLYNFGVPSTLKAYFDHIARAGITFSYTAQGPVGLLKGKRVVAFATRGGMHAGTPGDTQSAYVRNFLGFLGLDDVTIVYAEGLAMGEAVRAPAIEKATQEAVRLANASAPAFVIAA